ncbi:hypothetical protein CDAR_39721 [Caerostris darwini]|uniref:Uncharacterized protein n=1 Tax=Caerostris darwini TaxID=1538125 RepID=A0AAV4U6F2_9ARAC|nr:hypothetical protein CDAR_39721 [Caerostris darwini]
MCDSPDTSVWYTIYPPAAQLKETPLITPSNILSKESRADTSPGEGVPLGPFIPFHCARLATLIPLHPDISIRIRRGRYKPDVTAALSVNIWREKLSLF